MAETDPQANQEQDVNPWSVAGAQNEAGEIVAIDYVALSKSVAPPS
jgi:tryptophanyl-tRNA synthetase